MRRADRLFRIVQHLRGGRLVTARGLAERLEVSPRTIYRDMADLIGSGVPVEGEAGVGYVLRAGHDLPPLMFTADEITALVAGARMVQAWGGAEMAAAAEEALVKIEAVLPEAARSRATQVPVHVQDMGEMPAGLREMVDRIRHAVDGPDRLQIAYRDEAGQASDRIVRPLGLWFWGKVWTMVAWCELRRDFRMFRLDRIAAVETVGRYRPEPGQSLRDFLRSDLCGR